MIPTFKEYTGWSDQRILSEEMARIFKTGGYEVRVYGEPLGNPSFHLIYGDEWEVVLRIKDFEILEVKYGSLAKGCQLNNKVKKDIKRFLLSDRSTDITYWKFLLMTWNAINFNYPIDESMEIPI
jgi:hypothetical protein